MLATRVQAGSSRILKWNDRNKYYNDELSLTFLEEVSLELVYWLEDAGYPAIIVPPTHVDPWRYDGDPKKHQRHADLAAARGGGSRTRHAGLESSIANPRSMGPACCSPRCSARSTSSATSR